jgi:16S rRNA (guanine966-N2)-methyltransferase
VRIIAGAWRGRALRTPPGTVTRPTAERLRQALFDMLLHTPALRQATAWPGRLEGVRVLDAFAGTGALGLEALSRGAAAAWFIEHDRAALAALRANVAACGAGTVLAADVLRPPPGVPCGLVFLDPPYGQDLLPLAVARLAAAGWLAPGAVLVAEAAADEAPALGLLLAERRHGAGRVTLWAHGPV